VGAIVDSRLERRADADTDGPAHGTEEKGASMHDEPIEPLDDDERNELLTANAYLLLDTIEKGEPEEERYDTDARDAFAFGYRCGSQLALIAAAFGTVWEALLVDPEEWTAEALADKLERNALGWLAHRQEYEVDRLLGRILDDEGDDT
jgi:hypothetical protein